MTPFQTTVDIKYNGSALKKGAEQFSYSDPSEGSSDSVSIVICNIDKSWINENMPEKENKITAAIKMQEGGTSKKYDCGTFILDDIGISGAPSKITMGAVSDPTNEDFKQRKRSKTWSATTLKQVASDISTTYALKLVFDATDVAITSLEQDNQTDSEFLNSLITKYGYSLKVYSNKIIIYEDEKYENKSPVATFSESDMEPGWNYHTTIKGSYTGVKLSYTDPNSNETYSVEAGTGPRILELNEKADNKADASRIAIQRVNKANEGTTTLRFTLRKPKFIPSTSVIKITGLGKIDGNYFVTKVSHSIGTGYKVQIDARKIEVRIKEPSVPEVVASGASYTVVSGDSLWKIAKKFYNSGAKWTIIYNANKDTIESTAKAHGKASSDNGHWIWPGETLTIPVL